MKKLIAGILLLMMLVTLSGCRGGDVEAEVKEMEDPVKVALLLSGPINDNGWNALGYSGLLAIKETYPIETSYTENVQQSDHEEVLRSYSQQGYQVVFAHSFQFTDAAVKAAGEFPDTLFVVVGSDVTNGTNLIGVNIDTEQQGFVVGALAALISETGKVANIGGVDIPPIRGAIEGVVAGAAYVDPTVTVYSTFTGSFEDVNGLKEITYSMMDEGADVGFACANQAGMGLVEAIREQGMMLIGCNTDKYEVAPESTVNSAVKDGRVMFTYVLDKYMSGNLDDLMGKAHLLGIAEGCIYMAGWHDFENWVPDKTKSEFNRILKGVGDGSIDYKALVDEVDIN